MGSQLDLDQGGTAREWVMVYMGPSVGYVRAPRRSPLAIIAAGTYTLNYSTNLVEVNVAGAVTIILPSAIDPKVPAGVLPGDYVKCPITIVDIGGFAGANPITIEPASGSETILGEASIQITASYGGYSLIPSNTQQGWTNPQ
jgi:hypothetical protein